ncbi:hypothetical protein HMPREF2952_10425 [Neisseria sp. HMSC068C12]|jgi:hypothetical protein|uniref:YtxH domain-containing protein n=1 Tax=Neisseria TaxID=482 RepID=UPI0008A52AFC|nr:MULTISPECIES: YtxH domain-containing protein [Neisseria]OFQ12539.1 hypothetical protein HMPREF2952_10425 [Neisseria sp. HMSC068C12]
MSNENKTESIPKNNKIWNVVWNISWMTIIFLLCISPIIFIYFNNTQSNKNYLEEISSKNMIYTCKSKSECQVIQQKIQQIRYEIQKEYIENIQIKIDNQDKIINSLTFSVSLYAVLITVISIFFSLRESQRIDKALDEIDEFKEKSTEIINEALDEIDELKEKLTEKLSNDFKQKLEELKNDFEGKYNNLVRTINLPNRNNEELTKNLAVRNTDKSIDIDNNVLQNETNENSTNKNELNFKAINKHSKL